jgi:hypothetical protein
MISQLDLFPSVPLPMPRVLGRHCSWLCVTYENPVHPLVSGFVVQLEPSSGYGVICSADWRQRLDIAPTWSAVVENAAKLGWLVTDEVRELGAELMGRVR